MGSFRQSMAWLHTWSGLVVGWLLFAIFLTGTASFFRQEISLWMRPELPAPGNASDAAALALDRLQLIAPDARRWLVDLPDERDPLTHLYVWRDGGRLPAFEREALDAATGQPSTARATYGGDFLYYFHFDLHMPSIWGRLIVGAAAVTMLVALVSGVIIHRRIFRDFFTFRPGSAARRAWLDGHNLLAVLALPFHFVITYTGLVTLMFLYMPWGIDAAYMGDRQAFLTEASLATSSPPAAGVPAPLAPIGPLLERASRRWDGDALGRIDVHRPGDANALIELTVSGSAGLAHRHRQITFDGVTGALLIDSDPGGAREVYAVLYGLHLGRFADPPLRWLYFVSGLAGTAMIGSGLVLWVAKRRPKPVEGGRASFGHRLVEALNIAAIAGLPIAVASFFWANRLVPVGLSERADWEVGCFFAAWAVTAGHAALRPPARAWLEQFTIATLMFALLPLLNGLTGGTHLVDSLSQGRWVLAGFDLAMLATGFGFAGVASVLARRARAPSKIREGAGRSGRERMGAEAIERRSR